MRALILTVGTQAEQVKYCLDQRDPDYAVFIGTNTPDCRTAIADALDAHPMDATRCRVLADFPDNPGQISQVIHAFNEAHTWLKQQGVSDREIEVDPTGGRKWMSAGVTMIASFLDLRMIYVHRDNAAASMQIMEIGNAYDKVGFLEEARADHLFNRLDCRASADIYERLERTQQDPRRIIIKLHIARAYDAWSGFRFLDAHRELSGAVERLLQYQLQPLLAWGARLQSQREVLAVLRRNDENREEYVRHISDDEFSTAVMRFLYAQQERDARRGRYEHAIIILYRMLEFVEQWRLALRGVDTENVREDIRQQYDGRFRQLTAQVYGEQGGRAVPQKAALMDAWMLLWCMGDNLLHDRDERFFNRLMGRTKPRNYLWIEHRNRCATQEQYQQFQNFVMEAVNPVIAFNDQDLQAYRFIEFI